jgi:GH15 family glucan-1,4-alpha-glucosidase
MSNAAVLLTAPERERVRTLVRRSIDVIESNQSPTGAYPASPNFPVYRFSWFRDGSFIADAMSRVGRVSSANAFFRWCSDVVTARTERVESLLARNERGEAIPADEFLPCRYTLDGQDSHEEWWEFQLDGYGTWLWAVDQHARRTGESLARHADALDLVTRYLTAFWSLPCYDWWEEHAAERHTSTLAALHAGLAAAGEWQFLNAETRAAAGRAARDVRARVLREGVRDGRLVKWLGGEALDASLLSCATPFRLVEPGDPLMHATVAALEAELAHGGVHRYAADTFFGGGEWLLLSALLGWHYAEVGRVDDACAQLRWLVLQAEANGDLPEQSNGHLLAPEFEQQWVERWGPVATPLLWSHAMLLTLVAELGLLEGSGSVAA